MTLLEKCMAEHPGLNEENIVTWMCPCDFGYEDMADGCEQEGEVQKLCRDCWNRPADAACGGKSQPGEMRTDAEDGPPRAQGESAQSVERGRPGPSAPTDNGGGADNGG